MTFSALWLLFGGLSFLLGILHPVWAFLNRRGCSLLLFFGLSCQSLTLLSCLWMVREWTAKEDWSAMLDVVPAMSAICALFVLLTTALHLSALLIRRKRAGTN